MFPTPPTLEDIESISCEELKAKWYSLRNWKLASEACGLVQMIGVVFALARNELDVIGIVLAVGMAWCAMQHRNKQKLIGVEAARRIIDKEEQ